MPEAAPPRVRFSHADAERAHDAWGCNCGPGAAAAVLGLTLDELVPHVGDFAAKRYTNPTLMWSILRSAGATWRSGPTTAWPSFGLARIQWEGPWTALGVPMRARYRHTHWVASCVCAEGVAIFDINAMHVGGWIAEQAWSQSLVPWLLREAVPRANGLWHRTHCVELPIPARP